MPGTKRKRASRTSADSPSYDFNEESESNGTKYEIRILTGKRIVSKKDMKKGWSEPRFERHPLPDKPPIAYSLFPEAGWKNMNRYKTLNMEGLDEAIPLGRFIYVSNGKISKGANIDTEPHKMWVAKILEVRAVNPKKVRAVNPEEIYVRVLWMYWPQELPMGRQSYHSRTELIASNDIAVIDASTIANEAEVSFLPETYNTPTVETLFWRQSLDVTNKELSKLRRDCVCKNYHNPDDTLVLCEHCGKWLHEPCLIEDAVQSIWAQGFSSAPGTEYDSILDSKVASPSAVDSTGSAGDIIYIQDPPSRPSPAKKSKKSGAHNGRQHRRRRSSTKNGKLGMTKPIQKPWDRWLFGFLECREKNKPTGRIVVRRLSGKHRPGERVEVKRPSDLVVDSWCLFCHKKIDIIDVEDVAGMNGDGMNGGGLNGEGVNGEGVNGGAASVEEKDEEEESEEEEDEEGEDEEGEDEEGEDEEGEDEEGEDEEEGHEGEEEEDEEEEDGEEESSSRNSTSATTPDVHSETGEQEQDEEEQDEEGGEWADASSSRQPTANPAPEVYSVPSGEDESESSDDEAEAEPSRATDGNEMRSYRHEHTEATNGHTANKGDTITPRYQVYHPISSAAARQSCNQHREPEESSKSRSGWNNWRKSILHG